MLLFSIAQFPNSSGANTDAGAIARTSSIRVGSSGGNELLVDTAIFPSLSVVRFVIRHFQCQQNYHEKCSKSKGLVLTQPNLQSASLRTLPQPSSSGQQVQSGILPPPCAGPLGNSEVKRMLLSTLLLPREDPSKCGPNLTPSQPVGTHWERSSGVKGLTPFQGFRSVCSRLQPGLQLVLCSFQNKNHCLL